MSAQAEVSKLVSRLRIPIAQKYRRLSNPEGPEGRVNTLRSIVTALLKYERIEVTYSKGDEARGYVERLISDAIRHGDCHKETMDMANFWIEEKNIIHKLFKVLAPRFENMTCAYTKMYAAPVLQNDFKPKKHSVLELRGNPFPSLVQHNIDNKLLIHNVLLEEAKKQYRAQKYAEIAKNLESGNESDESKKLEKSSTPIDELNKINTDAASDSSTHEQSPSESEQENSQTSEEKSREPM